MENSNYVLDISECAINLDVAKLLADMLADNKIVVTKLIFVKDFVNIKHLQTVIEALEKNMTLLEFDVNISVSFCDTLEYYRLLEKKEELIQRNIIISKLAAKETILPVLHNIFQCLALKLSGDDQKKFFAEMGRIAYSVKDHPEKKREILCLILNRVREQSASDGFIESFWKSEVKPAKIKKTEEINNLFSAIEKGDVNMLEEMSQSLKKNISSSFNMKFDK